MYQSDLWAYEKCSVALHLVMRSSAAENDKLLKRANIGLAWLTISSYEQCLHNSWYTVRACVSKL